MNAVSVAHRRRLCRLERQPPAVDNARVTEKYSGKTKPGVAGLENHASGVDGGSLRELLGLSSCDAKPANYLCSQYRCAAEQTADNKSKASRNPRYAAAHNA